MAEADLLRRLQGAAAGEADLRHMLRRRDIRIQELKREQITADRLAKSSGGTPWSTTLAANRHPPNLGVDHTAHGISVAGIVSGSGSGGLAAGSRKAKSVAEQAANDVATAATVKRLELELAEAAARGDVGDAATRLAERLAFRMIPETSWGMGGNECRLCGRRLPRERRSVCMTGSQARGESFFMPSAEVERKVAAAAAVAAVATEASQMTHTADGDARTGDVGGSAGAVGTNTANDDILDAVAVCSDDGGVAGQGHSVEEGLSVDDLGRPRASPRTPTAASQGLGSSARSLEEQLVRLEAVVGRGSAASADADDGRFGSSPPVGRSGAVEVAWAEAVRELKAEVGGLRNRAEANEQLLSVSTG